MPCRGLNLNAFIESWHAQLERECLAQEFATFEVYHVVLLSPLSLLSP